MKVASRAGCWQTPREYGWRGRCGAAPCCRRCARLRLSVRLRPGNRPALVQPLVPQTAVQALDEAVLDEFARPNELHGDAARVSPLIEVQSRELGPVVADERRWQAGSASRNSVIRTALIARCTQGPGYSREQLSTSVKTRTVRPLPNVSDTKAIDHRSLGTVGVGMRHAGVAHALSAPAPHLRPAAR
jgi:hypothetical protein